MKRTPPLLLMCCVVLPGLIALLGGCQRSTETPEQAQQAEDAKLREALERTGQTMEELTAQVERQQSREAQRAGDPPVVRDLGVARAALAEAQKLAAAGSDAAATGVALARLRRALQSIAAELPAAVIAQHVDRALHLLAAALAMGSKQFTDAQLELVAAYDAANHGQPADLVPAVINDLDGAIKTLKRGDAAAAAQALNGVITKTADHASVKLLAQAQTEARNAQEALERGAWAVVAGELTELESLLTKIVTAKASAPETPAKSTAPAPTEGAGQPPAATATPSTQPTGQQLPAAQTTPAPQPTTTPPAGGTKQPAVQPSAAPQPTK